MAETLTYDNTPEAEVLNADEQDSLEVGEQMLAEQEGLLAGKYKDASQLEQAYLELQKKLGEGGDEGEEEDSEEYETEDEEYEYEETEATQAISQASAEFYETGEISEETFEALSQMSSADLLGAYMSMQDAAGDEGAPASDLSQSDVAAIKESVGGDEAYTAITEWAGQNLSEDAVDAFEAIIDNGSPEMIQLAVDGLKAKYDNAFGSEGRTLQGKPPANSRDTFRSQAEVVEAISDPRYENDEAYRNDVLMKLDRSDISF